MENVGVFQEETTSYVFPLEFYAFRIPIKKWHPVDVLAICKVHNFHLSGSWPADFLREIIANLEDCELEDMVDEISPVLLENTYKMTTILNEDDMK